jgi:hypothetical protein
MLLLAWVQLAFMAHYLYKKWGGYKNSTRLIWIVSLCSPGFVLAGLWLYLLTAYHWGQIIKDQIDA